MTKQQSIQLSERVIGTHEGSDPGPLLVVFGGMHGNEPAGVRALELVFKMLEVEPITNPGFCFRGRLIGLKGNLRAMHQGKRFVHKDLNRHWDIEHIRGLRNQPPYMLDSEDLEMLEIYNLVQMEIEAYQPESMVVLDLHTTSAQGGIFAIPSEDAESVRIATGLHVPVIKGLLRGLSRTSLHFFTSQNFDLPTTAVCFESGQHDEPLSVNRAIAGIINCMRAIGCVDPRDVASQHDKILMDYSRELPRLSELLFCYHIRPEDDFRMAPGFVNFQKVQKGEVLAHDRRGPIKSPEDSRVLMPLYQKQGNDGFFLIKDLEFI